MASFVIVKQPSQVEIKLIANNLELSVGKLLLEW